LITIDEIVHKDEGLSISYSLDNSDLIGEKITIEIWILNEDGVEIKRFFDEFAINQEPPINRDVLIELPEKSIGIYSVYFAVASDLENFAKQSVVLGKSTTTGMAIFETTKGKALSYGVFILAVGVGIFFIIRGHGKKVRGLKVRKNKKLLRKKKG
jgi:hypothetical protein